MLTGIIPRSNGYMTNLKKTSDTFCPLLFQHLATHPHGGVTHCCIADHRNALSSARDNNYYYNLNTDTIYETFNSKSFQTARLESLQGKKPKACLRCFDEEEKDIESKRLAEIKNYPEFTIDKARYITSNDGTIANIQFDFIELRLGNVCNVKCRTCNPASSSKWYEDYDKLRKRLNFNITDYDNIEGTNWPDKNDFWDNLFEHCSNIKTFYINGGEPTLNKLHFKFLDKLALAGKTNVKLWYNINMTFLNEKIIDIWRKFDNVKISCSIDDLEERNHYIRYPTNWDDVMKNFLRLKKENFELDITQTISFMNYLNLDKFYDFFHNKYGVHIHHNFVYDPLFLSPSVLPEKLKNKARKKFENMFNKQILDNLTILAKDDNTKFFKRALSYTYHLDNIRNQKFTDYFPEFSKYIK